MHSQHLLSRAILYLGLHGLLAAALPGQPPLNPIPFSYEIPPPGWQVSSYLVAYYGASTMFAGTVPSSPAFPLDTGMPAIELGMSGPWNSQATCTISRGQGATVGEDVVDLDFLVRGPGWGSTSLYWFYGPHFSEADIQGSLIFRKSTTGPSAVFVEVGGQASRGACTVTCSVDVEDDSTDELQFANIYGHQGFAASARARCEPAMSSSAIRVDFHVHSSGDSMSILRDLQIRIRIAPALAASVTPFGSSCPIAGTTPSLTAGSSLPQLGQTCILTVDNLPTSASPFVLGALSLEAGSLGGTPLPIDLTPIGMPGCSQYIDPILTMLYGTVATNGTATWPLYIPDEPWVLGLPFYAQCLVDAPGENPLGLVTTNALTCVAGL